MNRADAAKPIAVRPRHLVHRGVVEASAVAIDAALVGARLAARRAIAAWAPGATVHRVGSALLVRFATPRWIDAARAPGLPLVAIAPPDAHATGAARDLPLASAPLAPDEIRALEPPPRSAVLVRDGVASIVSADAELVDPAAWLDVAAFAIANVVALGPRPAPPRTVLVAPSVSARRLLGVGDAPPESQTVLEALGAARAGQGRTGQSRAMSAPRAQGFAALLGTLATWLARVFAAGEAPPLGRRTSGAHETSRALVVVAQAPPGFSFLERASAALRHLLATALVRARLAPLLGRRQAEYLGRMMDMFERGDLDSALRHAIPLGSALSESGAAPLLGVPAPRSSLAIWGNERRAGTSIAASDGLFEELRRRYRAAFERLEREGRIEEAAFVLAELLRESAEAVAFLERHGKLRLAAEVADARDLPPPVRVRQWLLAGEPALAVRLARRHGVFSEAVARLHGHPQGVVLRVLWGETLAAKGDFAAAVDVVWQVPDARALAEAWLDAAIAQGGPSGARMLARKLMRVPGSFEEIRARVLSLCDDEIGLSEERRALARALVAEGASELAQTLARPLVRALVRDAAEAEDPALKALVGNLEAFAKSETLRADMPDWRTCVRVRLAEFPSPRSFRLRSADAGATPIHDAAHLRDGRVVLALGEAGIRVLGRNGRPAFHLDQPAHRLVLSDRGDRALALAPRGDAWRIARVDLVGRRSEVWCEARFDVAARDFDGETWVIASGRELLVIDALERRFDALARFELDPGACAARAIARSPMACVVLVELPAALATCLFELPSWTLRGRAPTHEWPRVRLDPAFGAAAPDGTTATLTRLEAVDATAELFQAHLFVARGARGKEAPLGALSAATPVALELRDGWIASALRTPGELVVELRDAPLGQRLGDAPLGAVRATVTLEDASTVSLRFTEDALTIADDRGRVLALDFGFGSILCDARVSS